MIQEIFDSNSWRIEKYGGKRLKLLAPEEYRARLHRYEDKIRGTIFRAREEFREEIGAEYDIVGAAIYGSWARGDPHDKSDLDLVTLSVRDPVDLKWDFINRLREGRIGVEVDYFGDVTYTDKERAREFFREKVFDSGLRIITPYQQVEAAVRGLLQ